MRSIKWLTWWTRINYSCKMSRFTISTTLNSTQININISRLRSRCQRRHTRTIFKHSTSWICSIKITSMFITTLNKKFKCSRRKWKWCNRKMRSHLNLSGLLCTKKSTTYTQIRIKSSRKITIRWWMKNKDRTKMWYLHQLLVKGASIE